MTRKDHETALKAATEDKSQTLGQAYRQATHRSKDVAKGGAEIAAAFFEEAERAPVAIDGIEHADHVAPSADNVVRAIRAYACVNKGGKWIEPTKHVEFSSTGPATNRPRKPRKSHAEPHSHTIDLQAEQTAGLPNRPRRSLSWIPPSREPNENPPPSL